MWIEHSPHQTFNAQNAICRLSRFLNRVEQCWQTSQVVILILHLMITDEAMVSALTVSMFSDNVQSIMMMMSKFHPPWTRAARNRLDAFSVSAD